MVLALYAMVIWSCRVASGSNGAACDAVGAAGAAGAVDMGAGTAPGWNGAEGAAMP